MDVVLKNPRPLWEVGVLYFVYLGAGLGGLWWGLALAPLSVLLIALLGGLGSVLWVLAGVWVVNHVTALDGRLTLHPETKTFTLNNITYPYSELNFYKSSLVAPQILNTPGTYSSQHIIIGVDENHYKIGDDVAANHYTMDDLIYLNVLVDTSNLSLEQKGSFRNWLQRVQIIGNHTAQAPENSES